MSDAGEGFLAGFRQFKFMRAFYGLSVSSIIAVVVTLLTRPEPLERRRGLVWGTVADALRYYKGAPGRETTGKRAMGSPRLSRHEDRYQGAARLPVVRLSRALAEAIEAKTDDLVYICDRRWWLGGLRSAHAIVGDIMDEEEPTVEMGPATLAAVVVPSRRTELVKVERLY